MQVSEVMTKNPVAISAKSTVLDAAKKMRDEDCGILPIVDGDTVVGVVTDRDIVIWAAAEEKNLAETPLNNIMSKELITCQPSEQLEDIADRMTINDVRRLVVLESGKKLVGIVSIYDLMLNTGDESITDEVIHHVLRYA